jgi:hypothetical protein
MIYWYLSAAFAVLLVSIAIFVMMCSAIGRSVTSVYLKVFSVYIFLNLNMFICIVRFHINLASKARAATEFRFLNRYSPFMIGVGANADFDREDKATLLNSLDESPDGFTPLCRQIREVIYF